MALPTRTNDVTTNQNSSLQREFDTMMGQLFNGTVTHARPAGGRMANYFAPYGVDVREDGDHLYVEAELPGFKKDEVEITLENRTLTIAAERKVNAEQPKTEWLLNERRHTRVLRSFTLPQTVSEQAVNATLVDGVLAITLNKREESKPRKIVVS